MLKKLKTVTQRRTHTDCSKTLSLLVIMLLAVSMLTLAESADAQSTHRPSVPLFSLKFIQDYYPGWYPPEGATIVTIQNQPYTPPSNLANFSMAGLSYSLRLKGHNDANWIDVYNISASGWENNLYPANTTSPTTVIVFPQWGFWVYGDVDFQVQAYTGTSPHGGPWTYQASDWSPTQTITVPVYSTVPSTSATPTPTQPIPANDTFLLIIIAVALVVIAVLLGVIATLLLVIRHRTPTRA